jgi:hypothetical protein
VSNKNASLRRFFGALVSVVIIGLIPVVFGPFAWVQVLSERLGLNGTSYSGVAVEDWSVAQEMTCTHDQSVCSISLMTHNVYLNIEPKQLPALKPLLFSFLTKPTQSGVQSSAQERMKPVSAWLEGRDMFMGQHALVPLSNDLQRSVELSGIIPVCVTGSDMVWRLTFQYSYAGEPFTVYADLTSKITHNK